MVAKEEASLKKLRKALSDIEVKVGVLKDKEENIVKELKEQDIDVSEMSIEEIKELRDAEADKRDKLIEKLESAISEAESTLSTVSEALNDE